MRYECGVYTEESFQKAPPITDTLSGLIFLFLYNGWVILILQPIARVATSVSGSQ